MEIISKSRIFSSGLLILIVLFLGFLTNCDQPQKDGVPVVKIDISKTGDPIEKYIYGQFIEHLGKCIYGGIWAEMLEDRKFYYPVTWDFQPFGTDTDEFWNTGEYQYLKASPWQVIGNESTVSMDANNPFTGDHTPLISATGDSEKYGIRQSGLGLVSDQEYEGRIILSGDQSVLPITIQLISRGDEVIEYTINEITAEYQSYPINLKATFSCDSTTIEVFSKGKGHYRIGTLSLMPSNNIKGWRTDVVELMKELNSPVYRWPGGNFVSGYNWRDGIGERDKRPPRKNPAWKGVEHNDVGIHEYMELMELLDTEPFIAVNTGLGTVEEVAEEIEYFNGSRESEQGQIRVKNGHPEPYAVKWWAVGNEMYGQWQLGHMPLTDYVKKHNAMAEAIWEKDPDAQLIAVGAVGEWSETMLDQSSEYMDLISEHIYVKELENVKEHSLQLKNEIRRVANAHRKYREEFSGLKEKNIRIAMDEWNYWYGDYIYGELGVRYHQKDAIGVAIGLHEFFRNSDIFFMANYAQTVNVIGCIKTTSTSAGYATTGLALKLYGNHFGNIPVEVICDNANLDVSAALTEDRRQITISFVNISPEPQSVSIDLGDLNLGNEASQWIIQNSDPDIYNVPGEEPQVEIQESRIDFSDPRVTVPDYGILMIEVSIN